MPLRYKVAYLKDGKPHTKLLKKIDLIKLLYLKGSEKIEILHIEEKYIPVSH